MILHHILRSSRISVICFWALLFLCGFALAQDKANRTVTVECDPLKTPDFERCNAAESLTIINDCDITIEVKYNNGLTNAVLAKDTIKFGCTNDLHDCYQVIVPGKKAGEYEYSSGCATPLGQEVPTLSEWGMIIFSLLILSLLTVVVVRRQASVAMAGGTTSMSMRAPLFAPAVFWKTLAATETIAVIGLAIAISVSGSLALRDIIGTLLSAAIVAYMTHLWIGTKR